MVSKALTYQRLHRLLLGLHFESVPTRPSWRAYRHPGSGAVILLADRGPDQPARPLDLISVRRHLAENGILAEAEFDQYLATSP
jgi:hypothetical protein